MKQKNSIVNKVNNKLTSVNTSIRKSVQHDLVLNIIRIVLLLYTAFVVPVLKDKHLKLVENQLLRFILVAVIIYLSFIDIVSALLLTIALLATIHRAGNTSPVNNVVNNVAPVENTTNNVLGNVNVSVTSEEVEVDKVNENKDNQQSIWNRLGDLYQQKDGFESNKNNEKMNELVKENNVTNVEQEKVEEPVGNNNGNLNGQVLNNNGNNNMLDVNNLPQAYDNEKVNNLQVFDDNNASQKNVNTDPNNLANNNNLIDKLNNEQPASETLTDNILRSQRNNNEPKGLTNSQNLIDIQENAVPGSDLLSDDEVKTLQKMHTAQGLGDGTPMGYKAKRYDGYHFKQGDQQNLVHNMMRNEYL